MKKKKTKRREDAFQVNCHLVERSPLNTDNVKEVWGSAQQANTKPRRKGKAGHKGSTQVYKQKSH